MLDDEETGYEPNDPKHPTYADRAYDRADQERKRAREGLTNATGNGMIGETATEPEEVPMNEQITVQRRTDDYPGALSTEATEGYVIVNAKTGGVMAGPYETEQFADSVRTLCGVMPDTRVAKAMIV